MASDNAAPMTPYTTAERSASPSASAITSKVGRNPTVKMIIAAIPVTDHKAIDSAVPP